MAGCSGCKDCHCRVIGGSGATVTGTGKQFDPYVVSMGHFTFGVEDTDCINLDLAGTGSSVDPYELTAEIVRNPSNDNLLVCDGDGLLVDCDTVVDCVGNNLGCGLEFNNGLICVMISEDDGNQIECRDDGLYASFDCDDLGCGLTMVNGEITVNIGGDNRAAGKNGLECDEDTGILGVALSGCSGLRIASNGGLEVTTPQIREQNAAVEDRQANLDIPNAVIGRTTNVTDANGTSTVQNCVTYDNTDGCTNMQGFVVFRWEAEVVVGPDRDLEVDVQQLIGGQWRFVEEVGRHYHEQGGRQIWTVYGERTVALNVGPGTSNMVCYRLMFHRARNPGDLTGDPNAEARLLSYSTSQQGILNWNR